MNILDRPAGLLPGGVTARHPLAEQQRGLWYLQQLAPHCGAYHLLFSAEARLPTGFDPAFLGEALFRFSSLVLSSELPRWAREVFAAILSPPAAINRALFDDQLAAGDLPSVPFFRGWMGGGVFVQSGAPRLGAFCGSAHFPSGQAIAQARSV